MLKRVVGTLVLLLFILSLMACRPHLHEGNYEGTLTQFDGSQLLRRPVSMKVNSLKRRSVSIQITDIQQKIVDTAVVSWSRFHKVLSLTLPKLSATPFLLSPVKTKSSGDLDWHCFFGSNSYAMSVCISRNEFIINVTEKVSKDIVFSLTGDFAPLQTPFVLEDVSDFTLKQAIERVQTKSFESMIEYQRVMEARQGARAAYLNLLPHFNYKVILAFSTMINPRGLIAFVADIAPFVIPTRWLKAAEARDMREAEKMTLDILRADVTNQVSALAYNYSRDVMDYEFYDDLSQKARKVSNHLKTLGNPREGILDEMTLRLDWVNNLMEQEMLRLENAIKIDKTTLALSMGYHNPLVINRFDIEEDMRSIESAPHQDQKDVTTKASRRALEVRQVNYLIHNAHLQKDEYYFNWADPDAPTSVSVSASVVPYAAKASEFIKELMVVREQKQSQVEQRATNAVINYQYAIQSYWKTIEGYTSVKNRVESIFTELLKAKSVDDIRASGPNLQWVLQAYMQNRIRIHAVIASYRFARTEVERVLYEGYYSRYQPRSEGDVPVLPEMQPGFALHSVR